MEDAILAVYRGPLEEFVGRRDALVKQLRTEKRREEADQVKALRKPSRIAWALNHVVVEDSAAIDRLTNAIADAQAPGTTALRTALENVRTAVRDIASTAARATMRAGQPVDASTLASALNAVIGSADAIAEMRAGRLAEIPEAGGLDFLAVVSAPKPEQPPSTTSPKAKADQQDPTAVTEDQKSKREELRKAELLRAELERAEATLATAQATAQKAESAAATARTRLAKAEDALQRAQEDVMARRDEVARAGEEAKEAAQRASVAERAVSGLRARVK